MMNNNERTVAQRIRESYTEKVKTELDELRELDDKVKRPANVFAYVFGAISAVIMGCGMSLVMTDIADYIGIENGLVPGIIIGVIGLGLALLNYPLYKAILGARRKKYGKEILDLSEKIINK